MRGLFRGIIIECERFLVIIKGFSFRWSLDFVREGGEEVRYVSAGIVWIIFSCLALIGWELI